MKHTTSRPWRQLTGDIGIGKCEVLWPVPRWWQEIPHIMLYTLDNDFKYSNGLPRKYATRRGDDTFDCMP